MPPSRWPASTRRARSGWRRRARIPRIQEFMARRVGSIGTSRIDRALGRRARPGRQLRASVGTLARNRRRPARPPPGRDACQLAQRLHRLGRRLRLAGPIAGDLAGRHIRRPGVAKYVARSPQRPSGEPRETVARHSPPCSRSRTHRSRRYCKCSVREPGLGSQAIRGLSAYDDPATPDVLIKAYRSLGTSESAATSLNTLAARLSWARAMLSAVETNQLPRGDLTADLVRQLRNLKDAALDASIARLWGAVRETTGDRARLIAQYKTMLTSEPAQKPERVAGSGRLRQGLPAVPHSVRHRRPGRPRSDGLQPCRSRLCAVERARPERLDRQRLRRARDRHH